MPSKIDGRLLWAERNPDKIALASRKCSLKKWYNSTIEEFNELFNKQGGMCAICGIHQSKVKQGLCVDHDHVTKKIRGLLCHKCNFMLGNARDNIGILNAAIRYLGVK